MSETDLKNIIKDEYIKCAKDLVYFLKKYVYIQHPQKGKILFDTFFFQDKVLEELQANDYNIILKSRQLGISTLVSGYALWTMIFNDDKNIIVIATKQDVAKNIITKVRYAYNYLPSWMKTTATEDNKLNMRLGNGSQIKAMTAAKDSGKSEAVSILIIDECISFYSYIYIRNKKTGQIQKVNIGDLYEQTK